MKAEEISNSQPNADRMHTHLLDMKLNLKEVVKGANVVYYESQTKPTTDQKVQLEDIVIHAELAINAIDKFITLNEQAHPFPSL